MLETKLNYLSKPLRHILKLSNLMCVSRNANTVTIPAKSRFLMDNKTEKCAIIKEGQFSIVRRSDGLYLGTVQAPMIAGLLVSMSYYIVAETDIEVCFIPNKDALEIITHNNMWNSYSYILAFYIDILLVRDEMAFGYNSYKVVRNFILDIHNNNELFGKVNISDFIMQRTNLSRSTVMNIISNLRKGGYIDIKGGRLTKLNKLPEKY